MLPSAPVNICIMLPLKIKGYILILNKFVFHFPQCLNLVLFTLFISSIMLNLKQCYGISVLVNVKIGTLLKRSVDKYFVDFDQLDHSFPLRLTLLCKKFAISKKVCLYGISVHKLMIVLKVFSSSKPKL